MPTAPLRVALTGGIASGKSHCLTRFADLGVPVLDADTLAHQAIAADTLGFAAVVRRFGSGIVSETGAIDRRALGQIVFADEPARRDLEAIVHPIVHAAIREWLHAPASADAGAPFRLVDVPLLYETHGEHDVDRVIVCACREDQQVARLRARGLTEDDAWRRLAAQLPLAEKTRRADYVIDTSGSLAQTDAQIVEVYERLRAEAAG